MTKRLMEVTNGRNLMVCLEGGYNLESISWAAESVLRTLTGEQFPLEKCDRKFKIQELRENIHPNIVAITAVRQCLLEYGKYWKSLSEFGNEYDQLMIQNLTDKSQISAGHKDNFIFRGEYVLKKCKQIEIDFYKDVFNPDSKYKAENEKLKKLIPKFIGVENINNQEYVVLENLNYGKEKGSVIDFKMGRSTLNLSYAAGKNKLIDRKDEKSTSQAIGYRVCGAIIKNDLGIPAEVYKKGDFLTKLNSKGVNEITQKIFASNCSNCKFDKINTVPLLGFIEFLEEILEFFEVENSRQFISSSIIAIVDNTTNKYEFKFIDFNHVSDLPEGKKDENVSFGIRNLLENCKKILNIANSQKKRK